MYYPAGLWYCQGPPMLYPGSDTGSRHQIQGPGTRYRVQTPGSRLQDPDSGSKIQTQAPRFRLRLQDSVMDLHNTVMDLHRTVMDLHKNSVKPAITARSGMYIRPFDCIYLISRHSRDPRNLYPFPHGPEMACTNGHEQYTLVDSRFTVAASMVHELPADVSPADY